MSKILKRTSLLLGGLIAAGAALTLFVGPQTPGLLKRAYLYGLPAYEIAKARDNALHQQHQNINQLVHKRELADHTTRLITTPNNDTLYSSAFLDLSTGPVRIDVPDFGSRYYSLAFIDAYTNNAEIIGQRTIGGGPARLLVVGPDWRGEAVAGERLVRLPTVQSWLLVRILIDGPADLEQVHALQDHLLLQGPAQSALPDLPVPPPSEASGSDFVRVVNQTLRDDPPPAADAAELADLAAVGIGPHAEPLSWRQSLIWNHAYPHLQKALIAATRARSNLLNGWSYSRPTIGDFGTDYIYRAAVALRGLLALPPAEAIYTIPVTDSKDRPLDGSHRYRLHLPAGIPPVKAFWSLTAYQVEADGGLYFTDNPIHRYSVGDRTAGLTRNGDGSLDLLIQNAPPATQAPGNWLPVPAGPFVLAMRAYLPEDTLRNGVVQYPPLERLDD